MTKEQALSRPCVRHCKIKGQHLDTCPDPRTCAGCVPRPAAGDSLLCVQCHALFRRALADIADLWPALRSGVTRKAPRNETGITGQGGHGEVGDLWNPLATVALLDVEDFVGFMIRLCVPAPRKTPTMAPGSNKVLLNLHTITRYYARFLSHHETLGPSLLSDALMYRGRFRQAIDGTFVRRIPLKDQLCAAEALAEDIFGEEPVLCGGQLVAIIEPADSTRRSRIVCSNDPRHTVDAGDWILHLEQTEQTA